MRETDEKLSMLIDEFRGVLIGYEGKQAIVRKLNAHGYRRVGGKRMAWTTAMRLMVEGGIEIKHKRIKNKRYIIIK